MVNPAGSSTAKLAKTAVIVVPIFAPSVIGKAFSIDKIPEPTIGTRIDVVMLELCTEKVIKIPTNIAKSPPPLARALSNPNSIWLSMRDFILDTTFLRLKKINAIAIIIKRTA